MNAIKDEKGRAEYVQEQLPKGGLFEEKTWRTSPRAFPISPAMGEELDKLGYRLHRFVRACNLLYRLSVDGRQPRWIAELLDRGKPRELIELSREKIWKDEIPRVIRPDIILTPEGMAISELDSVPGGMGVTGWLGQTYASLGEDVVGGSDGMIDGFASIVPGGDIVVSDEAATYRPEMEWMAAECNRRHGTPERSWRVVGDDAKDLGSRIYRFFELFDLSNVRCAKEVMRRAKSGEWEVTPPMKPWLEEKLWFALFWLRPLREFWRRELSDRQFRALQKVIPYSWIVDPQPLPVHAVLPRLEIHSWEELMRASQKERDLVLKVSGFSENAWGARGVVVGSDVSQADWRASLASALSDFENHPSVLQEFRHSQIYTHPVLDSETGEIVPMKARVRLCPYYFVADQQTSLGGALATLVPADKKLIHGMSDGAMIPAAYAADENLH